MKKAAKPVVEYPRQPKPLPNSSSTDLLISQSKQRLEASQVQALSDELKSTESNVTKLSRTIAKYKSLLEEAQMKNKVLEDALLFRADELELAGHAGLLSKVAQLKTEVISLKKELMAKNEMLESNENKAHTLLESNETLVQQIEYVKARLLEQEKENIKYAQSGNNLPELLRQAESERDTLLTYIQTDMQRSADIASQLEQRESELRSASKKIHSQEQQLQEANEKLEGYAEKTRFLEKQVVDLEEAKVSLEGEVGKLRAEVKGVRGELDGELQGKDDLGKRLKETLQKLHEKQSENDKILQDLRQCRQDLSVSQGSLELQQQKLQQTSQQRDELLQQVEALQKDVLTWKRDEQELKELREEAPHLRQTIASLRSEVDKMSGVYEGISRVRGDLQGISIGDRKAMASSSLGASSRGVRYAEDLTGVDGMDADSLLLDLSLHPPPLPPSLPPPLPPTAAQHAHWVHLPSLHALPAPLHTGLCALLADLQARERESSGYYDAWASAEKEARTERADREACERKVGALQAQVEKMEKERTELLEDRGAVMTLRGVMSSLSPLLKSVVAERRAGGTGALMMSGMDSSHHHSHHSHHSHQQLAHHGDVSPAELVEGVQELLAWASRESSRAKDFEDASVLLKHELDKMHAKAQQLAQALHSSQEEVATQRSAQASLDRQLQEARRERDAALRGGAELGERQNVLLLSLQSRLESLERDRQLRLSQNDVLQKREKEARERLFALPCVQQQFSLPNPFAHLTQHAQTQLTTLPELGELVGVVQELLEANTALATSSMPTQLLPPKAPHHSVQNAQQILAPPPPASPAPSPSLPLLDKLRRAQRTFASMREEAL